MHIDSEQVQQEDALWPWLNDNFNQTMQPLDENYSADLLDAWADLAYQQEQAMRESEQSEWDGIDEISSAERNACDHYNERYVISNYD